MTCPCGRKGRPTRGAARAAYYGMTRHLNPRPKVRYERCEFGAHHWAVTKESNADRI